MAVLTWKETIYLHEQHASTFPHTRSRCMYSAESLISTTAIFPIINWKKNQQKSVNLCLLKVLFNGMVKQKSNKSKPQNFRWISASCQYSLYKWIWMDMNHHDTKIIVFHILSSTITVVKHRQWRWKQNVEFVFLVLDVFHVNIMEI